MNLYRDFLSPFAKDIKNFILDTLFPINCLICGKEGNYVCVSCKVNLTELEDQKCVVCEKDTPFGATHFSCQTPHGADGLISIFDYHDENVAKLIIKGKYSFIPSIYCILGKILAEKLATNYQLLSTNYYLVPLPLSPSRKRWRGFNQTEILCEALSQELNLPIADILIKKKSTKVQKDLKKKEDRSKNVEGCFAVSPPKIGGVPRNAGQGGINSNNMIIHSSNFLLIDDVVTTGSTLLEAVKVLKRNGANKVWCLTIARD